MIAILLSTIFYVNDSSAGCCFDLTCTLSAATFQINSFKSMGYLVRVRISHAFKSHLQFCFKLRDSSYHFTILIYYLLCNNDNTRLGYVWECHENDDLSLDKFFPVFFKSFLKCVKALSYVTPSIFSNLS